MKTNQIFYILLLFVISNSFAQNLQQFETNFPFIPILNQPENKLSKTDVFCSPEIVLKKYDGKHEGVLAIQIVSGLTDYFAVRYEIPLQFTVPYVLKEIRFFNNDSQTVWPRVLVTRGKNDSPNMSNIIVEFNNVRGPELDFLTIKINELIDNRDKIYFVLQFPPGQIFGSLGHGPAIGGDVHSYQPGNLYSTDGITFMELERYNLAVELIIEDPTDLTITKINNMNGIVFLDSSFLWTLDVYNRSRTPVYFHNGDTLLVDNLSGGQVSYSAISTTINPRLEGQENLNCTINSYNDLICKAQGGSITLPCDDGFSSASFTVSYEVKTTGLNSLINPRTGGVCLVDPNNKVLESDETNNSCKIDTVVVEAVEIINDKIDVTTQLVLWNDNKKQFMFELLIINTSRAPIFSPLRAVFVDLSPDPPINPDLINIDNADFGGNRIGAGYEYSNLLGGDNILSPGEHTTFKLWRFNNPEGVNFSFFVNVFGKLSTPLGKIVAKSSSNNPLQFYVNIKKQSVWNSMLTYTENNSNAETPKYLRLEQNYPNPFNNETIIGFQIPNKSQVTINIYNLRGQLIRQLMNDYKAPGFYKVVWDSKDNAGKDIAAGLYFYIILTDNHIEIKKLMLLK